MYYVTCVIWGLSEGAYITNTLATLHTFCDDRLFVLLLGLFVGAEGVGGIACPPLVSKCTVIARGKFEKFGIIGTVQASIPFNNYT